MIRDMMAHVTGKMVDEGIVVGAGAVEEAGGGDMMMIGIVEVTMAETAIDAGTMTIMVAVVDAGAAGVDMVGTDLTTGTMVGTGPVLAQVLLQDMVGQPMGPLLTDNQPAQLSDRRR
jgi:hypothetical protein